MSLYQPWKQEETRQLAASTSYVCLLQVVLLADMYRRGGNQSGWALSSLTHIKTSRAPAQFLSPLETLHEPEAAERLYELSQTIAEEPASHRRKRGATQAGKGRAVSIGQGWEYTDEGDAATPDQGLEFETSLPKRRESAPGKRAKPSPDRPRNVDQAWNQSAPTAMPTQDCEHADKQLGSQLTTPPGSARRPTKRPVPPQSRNSKFKPGPFRNPVVTKPSLPAEVDVPSAKTVTIHRGWTSTEETVKSQAIGISKTTLDKLAAFRFRLSATAQDQDQSLRAHDDHVPENGADELHCEAQAPTSSTDYGSVLSEEIVINPDIQMSQQINIPQGFPAEQQPKPLCGNENDRNNVFFNDAPWEIKSNSAADEMSLARPFTAKISDQSARDELSQQSRATAYSANDPIRASPLRVTDSTDYREVASNESQTLGSVGQDHGIGHGDQTLNVVLLSETPTPEKAQNNGGRTIDPISSAGAEEIIETPVDVAQFSATVTVDPAIIDERQFAPCHPEISGKVQVGQPDLDDVQMLHWGVSTDSVFGEFDDGELDDADLLAMVSDQVVPELHPTTESSMSFGASAIDGICASEQVNVILSGSINNQLPVQLSPQPAEVDDEYPLEEGLEEDMLSLPEHCHGVVESFLVPPSLQYSFGYDQMSGEVYDKSLQFSPPKSRPSSASPRKTPDGSIANVHSPSQAGNADLVPGQMYDEDWSFIRSIPLMPDRAAESSSAVGVGPVTKRTIPLGPRKQPVPSSPAKTQNAIQTSIPGLTLDDSRDYEPLKPFARPDFPGLVADRCPIVGVSAQNFLRVCFRIGEMFKEGSRCRALKQDAVIELFAKVTFSSREPGTMKQHFQFADLWHDRPPFPNGLLLNYMSSDLAETESRVFVGAKEHLMARCIGRLRRDRKHVTGWLLDIINVRPTDWEEIKWTKRIVSAGLVKSENADN